jgi:hypothetical protein
LFELDTGFRRYDRNQDPIYLFQRCEELMASQKAVTPAKAGVQKLSLIKNTGFRLSPE